MKSASVLFYVECLLTGLLVVLLLVLCLQNPRLTHSFGLVCSKMVTKFSRMIAKYLLLDVKNLSEFVNESYLTSVSHNATTTLTEHIQSHNTDLQQSFNITTSVASTEAGTQSELDQLDITIGQLKSDDVQVDVVYDSCTLQAAKLHRIDMSRVCDVDNQDPDRLSSSSKIPSGQIDESLETKRAPERVSSISLSPRNQVKSTCPASTCHKTSDYYWQLLLQEFPLASDVSEDELQEQGYSKYADLSPLHRISEEIFQTVFDKLTAEEHRLMSFLTPEEEWEFLYFCERPYEWPLSSKSEEELDKLTRLQSCDFI